MNTQNLPIHPMVVSEMGGYSLHNGMLTACPEPLSLHQQGREISELFLLEPVE